jgi:APA family basic amino acid/polyamine antiporter
LERVSVSSTTPVLGFWSAAALVVGHTIAVGIFLTPAELIGAVASPALTLGLWVVCGLLALGGALTFGELASRYPWAGGPYVYLREAWGERIAFLYGWQSLLVMDPGITAALAAGSAEYIVVLWPETRGAERWLALGVIWALAALSMGGLTLSARVLTTITLVKVLAFAAVIVVALSASSGSWSHFQPFVGRHDTRVSLSEAVALALVSVFFSYGGFWEASRVAGEVRNAPRTMPAALALGVSCVTLVYLAMTIAFIYLVPVHQATSAADFARRAGEAMLGENGPSVLSLIVVLSVLASALALLIMAPRLYVAMSGDRLFPPALATVNALTHSPARATALLALLASVFVSVATFQQIVAFFMCTTLGFVALAAAALVVVRHRTPDGSAFRTPAHPVPAVLFVALVLGVVTLVAINRPLQATSGFAIVLLGLPAHRLFVGRHPAPGSFGRTE